MSAVNVRLMAPALPSDSTWEHSGQHGIPGARRHTGYNGTPNIILHRSNILETSGQTIPHWYRYVIPTTTWRLSLTSLYHPSLVRVVALSHPERCVTTVTAHS